MKFRWIKKKLFFLVQKSWNFVEKKKNFFFVKNDEKKNYFFWFKKVEISLKIFFILFGQKSWRKKLFFLFQRSWNFVEKNKLFFWFKKVEKKKNFFLVQRSWNFVEKKIFFW